jgi:phenylalanine-4-hydroxylase
MVFSREQNQIWAALMERQRATVADHASRLYLRGAEILALPDQRIPMLDELNREITPRTGWRVVRTTVRYSDAVPWYTQFARRRFMVTEYMRGTDELDFTPEPDMFHDIFGHLPFMVLPEYTALQEMFAPAFFNATESQREDIKRLAWYSTEFGLIKEEGDLKIFGAGLISSAGEIKNVLERNVDIRPFTIENVIGHEKAVWSFNSVLFRFDSLQALKAELRRYFDRLPDREWKAA